MVITAGRNESVQTSLDRSPVLVFVTKGKIVSNLTFYLNFSLPVLTATSCDRIIPQPLEGDVPYIPDSTEMPNPDDTIPDDAYRLEGDVLAPEPDSISQCSDKDELGRLEGEPPVSVEDPNVIVKD